MASGILAHWPNRITALRFLGACGVFVIFAQIGDRDFRACRQELVLAFWLFVLVALTDFLDGYIARRYKLESAFGRIADPFVDKVLVCGAMIFLSCFDWSRSYLPAWITVVVLAREFLVTGIRGYVESLGTSFGADWFGKIKMLVQCFAIGTLIGIHAFEWPDHQIAFWSTASRVLVWVTLVTSVASGLSYTFKARRFLLGADR
ncbi:MAG: CDP-diacylglycerol--glycerol-3-phosphate 3-phosphatidyltransferase [Planctomycetota bacterium]|nr:MAG: CDP-diacylglycerol--glycerol-3-phosphate 3-phosphatidyltransferase [Planctomycetota bacterium]